MNKYNKLISVIIPIYNTSNYINKCIESVINQTYRNLEILLIDDGSTDDSPNICDEWAKKDNRIKVFHKTNGGLSDARNYGIEKSNGQYLSFIDSDDWIEENMYEELVIGCEKYNKDIGCCNRIRVFNENYKYEKIYKKDSLDKKDLYSMILLKSDPSVCNKIFKKNLFNNISFPYKKLYEDIATIPFLVDNSNGAYTSNLYGYYYLQNSNSISHKSFNIKKMDYYYHVKKFHEFILEKYENLIDESSCFFVLSLTALITDLYPYKKKYKAEYLMITNELKNSQYISNKYIPRYKKIMIYFDLHHLGWLVNIIKKIKR